MRATRPGVEGYVALAWNSVDAWFEEEEQVFVHVRDPYSRIDVIETAKRVRAAVEGQTLAEGTPRILFETGCRRGTTSTRPTCTSSC